MKLKDMIGEAIRRRGKIVKQLDTFQVSRYLFATGVINKDYWIAYDFPSMVMVVPEGQPFNSNFTKIYPKVQSSEGTTK